MHLIIMENHTKYALIPQQYYQDSLDQCLSIPIKITLLDPMLINDDQFFSILLNVDHRRSLPINAGSRILDLVIPINTDHWEVLRRIYRLWEVFRINAGNLIGIDRHWALRESCKLGCGISVYPHYVEWPGLCEWDPSTYWNIIYSDKQYTSDSYGCPRKKNLWVGGFPAG